MSACGPVFVTPHAVRRCAERIQPGLSYELARDWLISAAESAHHVRPTRDGAHIFRASRAYARVRLIIAPPHGPGMLPVLVTVLAAHDGAR